MNKIKVIDLLNRIANGEEAPKKIKYNETIYYLNDGNYRAYNKYGYPMELMLYNPLFILNDEVEIIEEDKKIETIEYDRDCTVEWDFEELYDKINEIIIVINEMREDK